jgi:AraC-like DNA-binding protein
VEQLGLLRTVGLLETTGLPVKEIAALNGYVDAAHFHHYFKQQKGLAPDFGPGEMIVGKGSVYCRFRPFNPFAKKRAAP